VRPIKLKIAGINSFVEEQVIDFKTLTSAGLFGIFGQTGSGKSSILDGIVLSLYGYKGIPRDTKDFINTECDKGRVCFEFKIGSGKDEKTVISQRVFKRTKTGVSNNTAKLSVINSVGEIEKIVDKTTEIDGVLEELIGLSASEFTRTVFLPQGKFSSFLKLAGRERRRMLENILGLHEYGQKLSEKIKIRKQAEDMRALINDKELEPLAHLCAEYIKGIEDEVKEKTDYIKTETIKLNQKKEVYDKNKLILDDVVQIDKYKAQRFEHKKREEEIAEIKMQIENGKKANAVDVVYKKLIRLRSDHMKFKNEEDVLLEEVHLLEKEKNDKREELNRIIKSKEEEIPELKIKIEKLRDAINLENQRDEMIDALNSKQENLNKMQMEIDELSVKKEEKSQVIKDLNGEIKGKKIKQEDAYVSPVRREEVQSVYFIHEEVRKLNLELAETKKNLDLEKSQFENIKEKTADINVNYEKTSEEFMAVSKDISDYKRELNNKTKDLHSSSLKSEKENALYKETFEKMKSRVKYESEIERIRENIEHLHLERE
jgi:exonuclease SbcC